MATGKPPLTKKFDGVRYHLYDYGYANIFKARGEAVRMRNKGLKVRVARTPNGIAIYRKIG
jgi:hypothetical protein